MFLAAVFSVVLFIQAMTVHGLPGLETRQDLVYCECSELKSMFISTD